tara:strand:+ start:31514 stop:32464 length:951 start_codon:yes stop_codon:yes gene_type:complete
MKVAPKDFFLWTGAVVALYFSVGSFIILSFEYIERLFGNAIVGYDPYSDGIRFAIASLIVLFPIYIVLTRMLQREIRMFPEKKDLWVRRWLLVLTIFGSAVALIVDMIVLINTFLGGEELTASFLLKVLTVLIVFGGVFYYYLQDVRGVWEQREKLSKSIEKVVSLIVLVSIIAAFFIIGSPRTQRILRYDDQRISDLSSIQSQITEYYRNTKRLPDTIDDLRDPLVGAYIPTDPETREDYEYAVTGPLTFELCATFGLPLPELGSDARNSDDWQVREFAKTAASWEHNAGRTCFEREIDPERVPPYPKDPVRLRF